MKASEILKEIKQLPMRQKIYVVEKTLQSMRKKDESEQMLDAAEELEAEYLNNTELTAFTNLDLDDFYEAR